MINKPTLQKGDIKLSINRFGSFTVLPEQFHESQCGRKEKVDYKYEVMIEATDKNLIEPHKFVVDNLQVKNYFMDKYENLRSVVGSCEMIACDAIEDMRSWFVGEMAVWPEIDLKRIKVVIRGSDESFIVGEWIKK